MARLERLVNLTSALLAADRPLTAEELRERVPGYPADKPSFRRQFERDKEALRELGLPLHLVAVANESQTAYRVNPDELYLRDPGLASDELAALHLASRMVRMKGMPDAELAAWKLGVSEDDAAATVRLVDGPERSAEQAAAELPAGDALAAIFGAIAGGRAVSFGYREAQRHCVPRRLSFRNGHWYVAGYDQGREAERSFRIDRIVGQVVVGDQIDPPQLNRASVGFDRPWELGDGEAITVRVRIDAPQAPWTVTHLGPTVAVESHPDASITITLSVRNVDALRSFVLGFLDHAVVVEPTEMRSAVLDWVRTAL